MPFSKLEMSGRALPGVLERTKTTGAGKKVEVQHIFISVEAWLEEPRWLGVGYQLWKPMSEEGTSFWPCPTARASHRLLAELVMSQRKQEELEGVGRPGEVLLCQGAGTVWSEHSERVTLRSWAALLGVDNYMPKQLGRWQPSTDKAYVRSIRGNVEKAQDKLDEESIMENVVEKLAAKEMDPQRCGGPVAEANQLPGRHLR